MFVTKYSHSCLFIEHNNYKYLIDPGTYSVESGLNTELFEKVDYLLITHEHEDHMDIEFIKKLVIRFPQIIIKSNISVVEILKNNSISASSSGDERISILEISHENLFDKEPPQNVAITIEDNITHVGDSFKISKSTDILAFPIQAPWGSYTEAIQKIKTLSPKFVIPIHDWHWKDSVRKNFQARAQKFLSESGINLIPLEDGQRIKL